MDLKEVLGGWGKAAPSLHELAAAAGVPGKLDFDGTQVVDLWLAGRIGDIVGRGSRGGPLMRRRWAA